MSPRVAPPPIFPTAVVHVCVESAALAKTAPARRRAEHRLGRYCARRALRQLGAGLDAHPVGRDDDGAPRWPTGVVGSISHGDGVAAAVVASRARVRALGVDCERRLGDAAAAELAETVTTPDELGRALRLVAGDPALATTLVASAKESVFKALYPMVRAWFDFPDVELWFEPPAFRAVLRRELGDRWGEGAAIRGGYAIVDGRVHTGCFEEET